ncbi:pectin acetylesterase-family hydrolase [Nonomuraea sp. NPDC048826]|uniref:pectin acetylesterase-family hydrolase n=1 Tax=Nonomuraea sp. NPDC048826 TaxID=3364347 RepID=UPI00371D0D64
MTNISRDTGGRPRHDRVRRTPLLLLVALAIVLTGCSTTRKELVWDRVVPAGDCHCADGSPFSFWERRADPAKVVLFLNGGGVCWDATMCAFTGDRGENDFYDWNISGVEPENRRGMFDTTRADNPFADYSFLYVSSCTGDAHLGDVSQQYAPELTVEHRGYVNGTAALDHLTEHYPNAEQVVVVGKTAGSVAAPIYGGLVADRLPDAEVIVLGAQSGAWPDNPDFNAGVLDARWGAYDTMPDWAVNGLTVRAWGVPRFWTQAALHDPNLKLARFDFAYDPNATSELTRWLDGNPPNLLAEIDRNEAAIERAGVRLHSYTAPGADHQIFEPDKFYEIEVKGVRLVDWLHTLITDQPPLDVHCDPCGP